MTMYSIPKDANIGMKKIRKQEREKEKEKWKRKKEKKKK